MVYICFLHPEGPNQLIFAVRCTVYDMAYFNMDDLEVTLKGHMWPSLPRYSLHVCFLHPESSKWAYFCSMMHRFWDTAWVHDLERSRKVTCDLVYQDMVCTCLLYPKAPKLADFSSMRHGLRDTAYFNMHDLKMTLKGHMWPSLPRYLLVYICFLHPGCRKSAYFCSTEHRFRETPNFNKHYLDMILKGQARSHVTYFAQI